MGRRRLWRGRGTTFSYATLATPAILLVMDIGKPIELALLVDRLAATLIGTAIVIVLNVAMDRLISV